MPMVDLTSELVARKLRHTFVFGAPNSFKTTAILRTATKPLYLLSMPGERGWATIPPNVPGITAKVWQKAPHDVQSSESIRNEIEKLTVEVIAGKRGPYQTIAFDGFHQYYELLVNVASGGKYFQGEDFKPMLYKRAHRMMEEFLELTLDSSMEHVIFTSWNAREPDRQPEPGEKPSDIPGHQWPDLPGQAAKKMAGHFSVVAFARALNRQLGNGLMESDWLLKPDKNIWGANVKMDPRLVSKLPATCKQDFQELYRLIGAAQKEVECEDSAGVVGTGG